MAVPRLFILCLLLFACPALSAPQLSQADRERLADGTSDRDAVLDGQDGLYVLLRNTSTWKGDDFGGDAGAAIAPPPDYSFLQDKPSEARGHAYVIEGWLMGADRWPTKENHDADKLIRSGDPAWGDQVTRWTVVTEKGNADATIIVLFNDPNAKMKAPDIGSKVRIAARFYKLWSISDAKGKPFTYPVFVGGAAEMVQEVADVKPSGKSHLQHALLAITLVVAVFFILRWMLGRLNGRGGPSLREIIDTRRREREAHGGDDEDEEDIDDLPEDPVAALEVLRKKHETQ